MKYFVTVNGKKYEVDVVRANAAAPVAAPVAAPAAAPAAAPVAAPAAGGVNVVAPMPGTVLSVKANVGTAVNTGDIVFILEAMKMEVEVVAPAAGTVKAINVKAGDSVTTEQVMAILG